MLKIPKPGSNSMWTVNFQMLKLILEKAEEPEIKLPKQETSRKKKNIYFCFNDYGKTFFWITTNCGKIFKRWEYQTTWPASWEICMPVKKQESELDMEKQTGSKLAKENIGLYIVILLI